MIEGDLKRCGWPWLRHARSLLSVICRARAGYRRWSLTEAHSLFDPPTSGWLAAAEGVGLRQGFFWRQYSAKCLCGHVFE